MKVRTLLTIFVILLLSACEQQELSDIPDLTFSVPFYLDEPEFFEFDPGIAMTFSIADEETNGGYAGIILYKVSEEVIYAYDLCCPRHIDDKEELIVDGALAICPTDSAYYSLQNWDIPMELNTDQPTFLKSYKSSLDYPLLRVYN